MTPGPADEDVEDYDQINLDPDTLVHGSSGQYPNAGASSGDKKLHVLPKDEGRIRRGSETVGPEHRRQSMQVRLEETEEQGKYILTADDPEIQDILRKGIAREEAAANGKHRTRLRDLVFTRQFTTFDRQNPLSSESPFHGFFTLFWLAMVLMFFKVAATNWRDYGSILGRNEVLKTMFSRDVVVLGLTDLVMLISTSTGLVLQKLIARGHLRWSTSGWIIQNVWQSLFLGAIIYWTFYREWPWTHTIFMVLHALVFLMKQHSYAFYNGHLSGVYRRKDKLQKKLRQLRAQGRTSDDSLAAQVSGAEPAIPATNPAVERLKRPTMADRTPSDLSEEISDVARIAAAIKSGKPLDRDQMEAFERVILTEIDHLDAELKGKNVDGKHCYPKNLTWSNFVDWTCLPTLVYELEYPRQDHINWWYVAEKTAATFGSIGVMMVISQAYIYPPVARSVRMKEAGVSLQERASELPWLASDMLFPLLLEQLLSWYVIWECVLNVLAELTRFADRGFYGPWWNGNFEAYPRDWNRPVHNFLLRHVYHSSISAFNLSRTSATFITFLLSALVHELVMACLFNKVRGYLFTLQLLQLPLVSLSRSKFLKGRDLLGNLILWTGLFIGPSLLTACYLLI